MDTHNADVIRCLCADRNGATEFRCTAGLVTVTFGGAVSTAADI